MIQVIIAQGVKVEYENNAHRASGSYEEVSAGTELVQVNLWPCRTLGELVGGLLIESGLGSY